MDNRTERGKVLIIYLEDLVLDVLREAKRNGEVLGPPIFPGVLEFFCQKLTSIIATGSAVASSTLSKPKAKSGGWMGASGN